MNGMYMVRPTKTEVDAWAALVPGGADKWNWDSLFKGMQDSETFTAPSDDIKKTANIQFNAVSHGTSGPIHVTYPGLYVPLLLDYLPFNNLLTVGFVGVASHLS